MTPQNTDNEPPTASDQGNSGVWSDHDIRASLAITGGFSNALDSAFSELSEAYQHVLSSQELGIDPEQLHNLEKLEADCRFCLSRIQRSLDQLAERIERKAHEYKHNEKAPHEDESKESEK